MSRLTQQLEGSLALEPVKQAEVIPISPAAVTPMSLLYMAVQQGAGIDTIERLARLQKEMRDDDAKVAFDEAMKRAQGRMRRIGADATNPQTRSKYATYAKLDGALRPVYTDEGFALSFDTGEAPSVDVVRVLCYVSHAAGHTRTYKVDMPADGKGAKGGDVMTKTHASGAAMSYGMRYLLKMIFNVAVGETDDDGNGANAQKDMPQAEFDRVCGLIESAPNVESLKTVYLSSCRYAKEFGDESAIREFEKRKNAKYKELTNAGR